MGHRCFLYLQAGMAGEAATALAEAAGGVPGLWQVLLADPQCETAHDAHDTLPHRLHAGLPRVQSNARQGLARLERFAGFAARHPACREVPALPRYLEATAAWLRDAIDACERHAGGRAVAVLSADLGAIARMDGDDLAPADRIARLQQEFAARWQQLEAAGHAGALHRFDGLLGFDLDRLSCSDWAAWCRLFGLAGLCHPYFHAAQQRPQPLRYTDFQAAATAQPGPAAPASAVELDRLAEAWRAGDAQAALALSRGLRSSPADAAAARLWAARAAGADGPPGPPKALPAAMCLYAEDLLHGRGGPPDPVAAREWAERALAAGDTGPRLCLLLGGLLLEETAGITEPGRALGLLRHAAEQLPAGDAGRTAAERQVGELLLQAGGAEALRQARDWLERAAQAGDRQAMQALRHRVYGPPGSPCHDADRSSYWRAQVAQRDRHQRQGQPPAGAFEGWRVVWLPLACLLWATVLVARSMRRLRRRLGAVFR